MIYLDHNSTTIQDEGIVQYICSLYSEPLNPSSVHIQGQKAKSLIEKAREQILHAVGARIDKYKLIFTGSGTESNNLAIKGCDKEIVITSPVEHVSVLNSAIKHKNYIMVPVDSDGLILKNEYEEIMKNSPGRKFVSIMLANNETGILQNIKYLSNIAHKYDAIVHCDAVQAFGRIPISMDELDVDLLTLSSHKIGGPTGASALIYRNNIKISAILDGGMQERGLRPATENVPAISGFGMAANNVNDYIMQYKKIELLRNMLEEEILHYVPEVMIFGKNISRIPNTSCITMPFVKNETQLIAFDLSGIAVSAGSACSSGKISGSHVLNAMQVPDRHKNCAIRVSLGRNTTEDEINLFITHWKRIYNTQKNMEIISI